MPGNLGERRAGHITQLGFDSLAEVSASDVGRVSPGKQAGIATATSDVGTGINGEVRRFAPHRRSKAKKHTIKTYGIQQATLEELFATLSGEEDIPRVIPTGESWRHNGQYRQLHFDSLAEVPSDNAGTVQERKPAGNRIEQNGAAVQRSDLRSGGGEEDGLFESLGESDRPVPSARRRRVILDEPEPGRQLSRDFRITEAHGVGTGGLHEKAHANIAAIRLVKSLEHENRDAHDAEKAACRSI